LPKQATGMLLTVLASALMAYTPVIVIMSHPRPSISGKSQYMAASYVKWLELAGARVLPLSYHASEAEVDSVFGQVNGALFMGGGAELPPSARRLWRNAMAANAAGQHFPIWGSCLGFEWIMQLASGDDQILASGFDSENLTLPLNLTAAALSSRILAPAAAIPVMFNTPPLSVLEALSLPVTMNNHEQGLTPDAFDTSEILRREFTVLSTNVDRKGKQFVSMVEHASMPVWATQWHPEKNIFEQGEQLPSGQPYEVVQHTRAAVSISQYMANYFVDQCRRSLHRFKSPEEGWNRLIYKDTTSTVMSPNFVQVYLFDY